jgi:phage terminase small subunit
LGGPIANARHEQFAQLVASGKTPADAYVSAGFSGKGAHTSAARLLRSAPVAARVAELKQVISTAAITRAAVDEAWVLRLLRKNALRAMQLVRVVDQEGKETGVIAYNGQVANRSLELIGKKLGMFIERNMDMPWDGDFRKLTDQQLPLVVEQLKKALEEQKHADRGTTPNKLA